MIKSIVQRVGLSLMQLADTLSISRPTLDSYISAFDNGQKISNSFYQDIFEFLFNDANISNEEFLKRYKYMRDQYGMIGAAARAGGVSKLKSGYSMPKGEYELVLDEITKYIESDRISPETPKEIYTLLLFSLKNMTPDYLDLIRFYQFYAGLKDAAALNDEQKKRYAVLYRTLKQMDDFMQNISDNEVAEFIAYAASKDEGKKRKLEQIKSAISNNLSDILDSKIAAEGLDSVDIDKLIETLKNELGGGNNG